jgi:HipA-like protein
MIKVWTDSQEAGMLDRSGDRGSSFAYALEALASRAVSATMPVRLPSWDIRFGLPPIFEMNLPEGVLRERLRLAFAKATGSFDEFDLLGVVGRSQVGRIRYTGQREQLQEDVPFQSVDEILEHRRGGDLFRYLIEKFAAFSGISGVQPKVLVRDEAAFSALDGSGQRFSESCRGATHIVKFWEQNEYPQLAANEYAVTSHSSQGQTADRVLIHVDSAQGHGELLNSRMAYVSVSRAQYDVKMYTNDAKTLGFELSRDVTKATALDHPEAGERIKPQSVGLDISQGLSVG